VGLIEKIGPKDSGENAGRGVRQKATEKAQSYAPKKNVLSKAPVSRLVTLPQHRRKEETDTPPGKGRQGFFIFKVQTAEWHTHIEVLVHRSSRTTCFRKIIIQARGDY